jgi:hypothetical protein
VKVHHILLLCVAAATPQLALADLAVTNPAGLGQVHALLDFCTQFDPRNSASFQAEWQSIIGDQSNLLAQIEQDPAYIQQYAAFTSELQKLPRGQSLTICAVSAAQWNGGASKEPKEGPASRPVTQRGREQGHEPAR